MKTNALSADSGYDQHVLFENETGSVFWGSSFGNFMNEHIDKYDNTQYVSNLARYLQTPIINLLDPENDSLIAINTQISLSIVDDNLKQVKFNWNNAIN